MKLPIKFIPKGGKIIIQVAEDFTNKLKEFIKKKGAKLSKAAKRALKKKLAFLEKNPVLAVLHSIEDTFKKWRKEKMLPHLGEKISKHLEKWEYVFGKDRIEYFKEKLREAKNNPETLKKRWKEIGEEFTKTPIKQTSMDKLLRYVEEKAKRKNTKILITKDFGSKYRSLIEKLKKGETVSIEGLSKNAKNSITTLQELLRNKKISPKDLDSFWVLPGKDGIFVHFPLHPTIPLSKVVDEISHAVQELRGKKQHPNTKPRAYYQDHMENYGMFGTKGKRKLRGLLVKEEQIMMETLAEAFQGLQRDFEQYISGK